MVRKISCVSRRKLLRTYVYNVMRSCIKCDISGPDLPSPVARSYAENFSRSARNKRVARARKWGGLIRFPLEFMWRARAPRENGRSLSFLSPYDLTACLVCSSGPLREARARTPRYDTLGDSFLPGPMERLSRASRGEAFSRRETGDRNQSV